MKVTEKEIIEAIESSQSMREAGSKLPINFKTFVKYAKALNVYFPNQSGKDITKPKDSFSLDNILLGKHPQYNSHRLKGRLINERGWIAECYICKLKEWNSLPIPLELDHIDGNHYNQLENNLRLLCPNCHAQTPTYRNKRRIGTP